MPYATSLAADWIESSLVTVKEIPLAILSDRHSARHRAMNDMVWEALVATWF